MLSGQIATASAITSFSRNLELFSNVLAGSDPDLRKLIANGAAGASQLKQFLDENSVNLTELLRKSVTIGDVVYERLPGLRSILVIYPFVVEGGFTVVDKDNVSGQYDAHFGLVLTTDKLCENGYGGTKKRSPQNTADRPLNSNARCTDSPSQSNPRGAQNLKRAPYRGPVDTSSVIGTYDQSSGAFSWGAPE